LVEIELVSRMMTGEFNFESKVQIDEFVGDRYDGSIRDRHRSPVQGSVLLSSTLRAIYTAL
jgi:hypothetical protein